MNIPPPRPKWKDPNSCKLRIAGADRHVIKRRFLKLPIVTSVYFQGGISPIVTEARGSFQGDKRPRNESHAGTSIGSHFRISAPDRDENPSTAQPTARSYDITGQTSGH